MSFLFFYKIIFTLEIIVGETIFTFRLKKKNMFALRAILSIGACVLLSIFFPIPESVASTWWYVCLMFLILASSTFLYLHVCYEITFAFSLFSLLTPYTFQQFGYMIYTLITTLLSGVLTSGNMYGNDPLSFENFNPSTLIVLLIYFESIIFAFFGEYFLFRKQLKTIETVKLRINNVFLLVALLFLIDIILNSLITNEATLDLKTIVIYIYNIICCLLIVYVEKALITNIDIKRENDVLIDAVNRAKKQYETQKETIDLINIKCHDLKHQIKEYGGKHSIDETNIKEINNLISIYDSSIKTNNEVLNIILTEKSLQCSSFKIRLTCMIDATDLAFISNGDMYSLFGNILDNAIEAVREVEEESKRVIALNIHTINDFVVIKIDNYYEGSLQFNEGLPMTSKSDKTSHGFGLKSVRLIVNKYDGEINLETENQIFKLTILLPIK